MWKGRKNRTMKSDLSKIPIRILAFTVIFAMLSGLLPAGRQEAAAATTNLNNPKTASDGTVTWDCVYFGHYPQTSNGNGGYNNDPIKWRVLSVNGDEALLLSDKSLDVKPYNVAYTDVTWETCTIRSWLNGYGSDFNKAGKDYASNNFINTAFTAEERAVINQKTIQNPDNPYWGTEGGNPTIDKIFFLSIQEASTFAYGFSDWTDSDTKRRWAFCTDYAKSRGAIIHTIQGYAGLSQWQLRSPGSSLTSSAKVGIVSMNSIDVGGTVNDKAYGVTRPALFLNLKSNHWSYAGRVSSKGKVDQPVSIPKNATANEVLSYANVNNLISDISLGDTTINGPTVTIAGNTFPIFSFNGSADLKLNDKVQAKVNMKDKTVEVLIGFDKFDGSATIDKDTNSSNYWTESYAQVKSLYKGVVGENGSTDNLYHGFQKLRGKLRKTDCAIGIKASAEVAGYAEFSFASGKLTYTSGGILLNASLGYEETQHLPPCPAVYVVFGLNAGFDGQLTLQKLKELEYIPSMDASIDLTATLGAGAGSKKLNTYAEVGLKGNVNLGVALPAVSLAQALTARLSASVYFDSKVLGFNGPSYGPETFAEAQIYPLNNRSRRLNRSPNKSGGYDWAKAELMSRDYLKATNTKVRRKAKAAGGNTTFSKTNLYPYNNAKLVDLKDGTKLLFWIDDNGTKSGVNKTTLMYAAYDGKSWGIPEAIAETGGANDYPSVYSDGTRAVVVWQKVAKMEDSASLPDVLKSAELYAAVYENGKFGEAQAITSGNTIYEMMQAVAASGDEIAVAWVENSQNDPFQEQGKNTIKLATRTKGASTEKTIATDTDIVRNLNLDYVSGELALVYETSENDDSTIHYEKGSVKKTYSGHSAQIENGILYYSDADSIKSLDILTGHESDLGLPAMNDFVLVNNGKAKALYTTVYHGYTSELVMYPYDASLGRWGDMVTLTNYGKYIRNYSVALDSAGNPTVALNLVTVEEQTDTIYKDSTLVVLDQSEYIDLELTDKITYEEDLVDPNGKLPISFEVKNNSNQMLHQFTAELLDETGKVIASQAVHCALPAGEIAAAQMLYDLPKTMDFHKATLRVKAEGETNITNNSREISLGHADLTVEEVHISGKRSEAYLEGTVKNIGYQKADNVRVDLYYNDDDTPFETAKLNALAHDAQDQFKVTIPTAYMDTNSLANGNLIRVEVVSDTQELKYDNNEAKFLIRSEEDMELALNASSLDLKTGDEAALEITYFDQGASQEAITWTSSDEKVAAVAEGKVTALSAGTAMITAMIGDMSAACEVSVSDKETTDVKAVMLNASSLNVLLGENKALSASVLPVSANNGRYTWKSEDDAIARVSANGTVTGVSVGETTITATAEDGYHSASCRVIVSQEKNRTYTLSFAGGEGAFGHGPDSITGAAESVVTLPDNPYSKAGVLFAGWSDGENTYKAGASYRIPCHDVEFVAQWNEDGVVTHTITATPGQNGTITPSGEVNVAEGTDQSFTITPNTGYEIESVLVDGTDIGAVTSYTFKAVTQAHTISATFKKKAGQSGQGSQSTGGQTSGDGGGSSASDQIGNANLPAAGTTLTDTKTKAKYKVSKPGINIKGSIAGAEVEYTKPSTKAKTIMIPDTVTIGGVTYKVTSIANNAFKNNAALTKVKIGNNIITIGTNAFSGCKKLKSVTMGKNVTTIKDRAFYKCTALTKLTIPAKVKKIGKQAFYGCKKLKAITIKTAKLTSKSVGSRAFTGIYKKPTVKIPKKKLKAYKKFLKKKGVPKRAKIRK